MYTIKAADELKKIMTTYFQGIHTPIAWCTSAGPAELLRACGFNVYFPENHGAILGATRTAGDFISVAMESGYSGDVCSYLTSDIGSHLSKQTALKKQYGLSSAPKPDLIVYNTNQCREVQDWFTFFANEYRCPVYGIMPPRHLDNATPEAIANVSAQLKGLVPICEKITGKKFDIDKFREVLNLSKEATELWKKVLETSKNTPAPLSFFDGTIHMGPIVVLRGTTEARDYYSLLLQELEENISNKKGFLQQENCRIFWEGMPIWGKLRSMSELFSKNNAAVVASTYCNSWVFDSFDAREPFDSCAKAYTEIFINRSETAKASLLKKMISDFRIDGIVFHDAKTCFNNSNARFGMPAKLKLETGIKTLIIEGDLCDLRFFSEGQTQTKVETFIEQLS
jgi:benzoyl-CoA reductase/2-hydroxyglutaryl-CoA dehydratase subunit BcrC/BadD/HgdB